MISSCSFDCIQNVSVLHSFKCLFILLRILQHPVASEALRNLTLVRGHGQSQNIHCILLEYYLDCIVRWAEDQVWDGSPPCDSDRLLMQRCCKSPLLSYEHLRLSKLRVHHLPLCAVTTTWTCDDLAWKQDRGSLYSVGSGVKRLGRIFVTIVITFVQMCIMKV